MGLDLGANTSTYCRFISSTHEPGHFPGQVPREVGMGPWMLPSQRTNCQSCLLCIPDGLSCAYAEKGGLAVQE